jgi:hypothetical protein
MPFASWAKVFWVQCVGFAVLAACCLGLHLYTHALLCGGMMGVDYAMLIWTEHLHNDFKDWSPHDS